MNPWKPLATVIVLAAIATGCSLSTEELTKQVRASMEEKFKGSGIQIQSLMLTKKGGNEYSGILETREPNGPFTYRVEVVYDGKTFNWQVKPK